MSTLLCLLLFADPIRLIEPADTNFAGTTRFVFELDVATDDFLGLELRINGDLAHYFEKEPFETTIDMAKYPAGPTDLEVVLYTFSGDPRRLRFQGKNYPNFHKEDVRLIRVPVLVSVGGAEGRELKPSDFEVRENGDLQNLEYLMSTDQPLHLLLLVDLSGSMEGRLPAVRRGIFNLLKKMRDVDLVEIIGFNHEVFQLSPPESDKSLVRRRFIAVKAEGATNLYGAVWSGIKSLRNTTMRRAVVLFTDGHHDLGEMPDPYQKDLEQCTQLALTHGVPLYTMGVGPDVDHDALEALADSSGGKAFFLRNSREIIETFDIIGAEIQRQYLLCYYTDSHLVGKHDISIQLRVDGFEVINYPKQLYFR